MINNVQVPGSVIASADLYLMWRPRSMEEVTPESLTFLEVIKPAPEVSASSSEGESVVLGLMFNIPCATLHSS